MSQDHSHDHGHFDALAPRFGELAADQGQYESYYLTAHHPDGGQAVWIRYTIHKRPGHEPTASLWCTFFDKDAGPPVAGKATFGADELAAPEDGYVRIDGAELGPHRATGAIRSPTLEASWDLAVTPSEPELRHLPLDWMYTGPLPRTKTLTAHPAALVHGTLRIGEREIRCDRWTGVIGHNWGAEHAERWIWLHCGAFEGRDEHTWIDLTFARLKVAGAVLPWVAAGAISLGGERHPLGGPFRARSTLVDDTPHEARFVVHGPGIRVEGRVSAPPDQVAVWRYASPDLAERHSAHCSVADLVLYVRHRDRPETVLQAKGTATYELGMQPRGHELPVQPYADGVPA